MRNKRIGVGLVALAAASALVLTACNGSGNTGSNSSGNNSAIITTNGSEPQNPLIPSNTNEVGGGKIVDSIFAGLVYYDAQGKVVNDVADSITTTDAQNYTIKIKANQKFTNGEKVTAKSFVDAWQYGALLKNNQLNSYFFKPIEGYSDSVDSPLTGLKVVDDTTFTVKLSQPTSDFALRLGYIAFRPLPTAAFSDMKAFGENPIGNGPYKLASPTAWEHNVKISLVTNPDYQGGRKPKNGGLNITFYVQEGAAYADLISNNLDVLDNIPSNQISTFKADLGDRAINQPAALFQSFTIPARLPHFSGKEGELRRQALSLAINREEITKVIFQGTRTPASDFTSPVIDGWSKTLKGADVLSYNPEKAKKLWAEADAISPWSGPFQIAYNADRDNAPWVDAVTDSLKNTLGIDASGAPSPTLKQLRSSIIDRSIQTAFRTGWQFDYPGLFNGLGPLYGTGAGANDGDYSNPAFDALLEKGNAEKDLAAANADYQAAQELLLKDLPVIPLWYSNVTGGYGTSVSNVEFGWDSVPLYYNITKK